MTKSSAPSPIVFIVITLALIGAGYWWFYLRNPALEVNTNVPDAAPPVSPSAFPSALPAAPVPAVGGSFPLPTSVASGTQVRIDGSTSMVTVPQLMDKCLIVDSCFSDPCLDESNDSSPVEESPQALIPAELAVVFKNHFNRFSAAFTSRS